MRRRNLRLVKTPSEKIGASRDKIMDGDDEASGRFLPDDDTLCRQPASDSWEPSRFAERREDARRALEISMEKRSRRHAIDDDFDFFNFDDREWH